MTRPKAADQARLDRKLARERAREAVRLWRDGVFGEGDTVPQVKVATRLSKDLALTVNWFPLAIHKVGKSNHWDMPCLESILQVDDPVTMLQDLAQLEPGVWFDLIAKVEAEGCSIAQEDTIRAAHFDLRFRHGFVVASGSDPFEVARVRYLENKKLRKK